MDAGLAAQPAVAALLEAAERHAGGHCFARSVDLDLAGAQLAGYVVRAAKILRVDVAAEAIVRGVGERDRLLLGVEGDGCQNWTEDLVLRDVARVGDAGDDGHRQEEPAGM